MIIVNNNSDREHAPLVMSSLLLHFATAISSSLRKVSHQLSPPQPPTHYKRVVLPVQVTDACGQIRDWAREEEEYNWEEEPEDLSANDATVVVVWRSVSIIGNSSRSGRKKHPRQWWLTSFEHTCNISKLCLCQPQTTSIGEGGRYISLPANNSETENQATKRHSLAIY